MRVKNLKKPSNKLLKLRCNLKKLELKDTDQSDKDVDDDSIETIEVECSVQGEQQDTAIVEVGW